MRIRKIAMMCACLGISMAAFGCSDDGGEFVKCDAGTFRCNGTAMEGCALVSWQKLMDCPLGCDETTGQCKLDIEQECLMTQCESATTLVKCDSNYKATKEDCPLNQHCVINKCIDKGENTPECQPQAVRCSDDNKGKQTCASDGKWGAVESCGDGKVCNASKECVDEEVAVICEEGKKECTSDTMYRTCSNNAWGEAVSCGENMVCKGDGACEQKEQEPGKVCEDGDSRCNETLTAVETCADNAWGETETCTEGKVCDIDEKTCVAASDAKVCTPSEKDCDGDKIKVCNEKGQWDEAKDCDDNGYVCRDKACTKLDTPTEPKCKTDEKKCDGSKLVVCEGTGENADWKETDCTTKGEGYTCDATKLECVPPAPQAVCQKGEIKCVKGGMGMRDQYQTCKDDGTGWNDAKTDCPNDKPKCDDGVTPAACIARCTERAKRCSVDGKKQTCNNGTWADDWTNQCNDHEKCVMDGDKPACKCTKGDVMCGTGVDLNKIYLCNDKGTWDVSNQCGNNQYCEAGACVERCQMGATKCDGNKVMTCNMQRKWTESETCDTKCVDGVGNQQAQCACVEGSYKCVNNGRQVCKDGKWTNAKACGQDQTCDKDTGACMTKICNNNTTICAASNVTAKCSDGQYEMSTCSGAQVCRKPAYGGAVSCVDMSQTDPGYGATKRCSYDGSAVETWDKNAKAWVSEDCKGNICNNSNNNTLCSKTAQVCKYNTYACDKDNKKVVFCSNNAYKDVANCDEVGMKCDAGKCVAK